MSGGTQGSVLSGVFCDRASHSSHWPVQQVSLSCKPQNSTYLCLLNPEITSVCPCWSPGQAFRKGGQSVLLAPLPTSFCPDVT